MTSDNNFKDLFSLQADDYLKFRPTYPQKLFEYLSSLTPSHDIAWDVGTGNGQAVLELAKTFNQVIATDPSKQQLSRAPHHPKVKYKENKAEASPLANDSADLITAAQAFHWFTHEIFFKEVKRVAKQDSILAIWCYELATITPEIDKVVEYYYRQVVGDFWEPERKYVETGYKTIQIPFDELSAPDFQMEAHWSLDHLLGYLNTWSATQKAVKKRMNDHPLSQIRDSLTKAWGSSLTRSVVWPLSIRIFRIKK